MSTPGLSSRGKKGGGVVTPTETNVHGDALYFIVKTWARHKTTETVLNNGRQLAAVGSGWRWAVGAWWRVGNFDATAHHSSAPLLHRDEPGAAPYSTNT